MLADVVAIIGKKAIIFQESSFRKKKNLLCESGKDAKYKLLYEVYWTSSSFSGTQDIVFGEVDR